MKIDIIVVHVVLLAAVSIPYILFILAAARQIKNLEVRFNQEAKAQNLKLDRVGRWNSNLIGIDINQQKVLFVQQGRHHASVNTIDLRKIKSIDLLQQIKPVKINKKNEELLQKIELDLCLYNGNKETISFYDCDKNLYQDFEMKNAAKWSQIIKESISLRPLIHTAA